MKSKLFNSLVLGILVIFFVGCSNLFNSKNEQTSTSQGKFVITLGLNKPNARFIRAFDYSITRVETWKLTLTDENDKTISLITGKSDEQQGTNVSSISYDSEKETITATLIPEGTYKVELEGTYTNDGTTYTIYGSATGISINANSTGKASIFVGPKTTENGTGSISLTLTDSDQTLSRLNSSLKAKLTKLSSSSIYYTTVSTDTEKSGLLTFETSENNSSSYILLGEDIKSGWYKISFSVDDNYRVYLPDNPDKFIEIVDNNVTISEENIKAEKGKAYYATNNPSSYNGLAASSPINLTKLFENLAEKMPDEGNIYIYVDGDPEIDIDALNTLKTSVASENKTIIIYNSTKDEVLTITGNGEENSTTSLQNSLTLVATENNTTLSVDSMDLTDKTTITFKEGATIDASNITDLTLDYTIKVYAINSSEENNYSAYSSVSFITTKEKDISNYISLYEYGETEVTSKYAVVYEEGKHYIKSAGKRSISPESFAEKVTISAKYSTDSSTSYENNSPIPYNNDTLTFSLSGLDDYNLDDETVAWYLNGDTTLQGSNETSFIPYEQSGLNIDDSNMIVCYVTINGTTYATSMRFTFNVARSAAVWFDKVNVTYVDQYEYYSLNQLGNDGNTATNATKLISNLNESPIYCFDKNFNLWAAVNSDTGLVLKKYSMILSSGLYNTTETTSIVNENIITTPIDMTYDATTEYFYFLEKDENENAGYTLHKTFVDDSNSTYTDKTLTLSITDTVTPNQIAVCGDIIYVAGSDCNIYKGTGVGTMDELNIDSTTPIASLASNTILKNYNAETEANYLSITDLQIGDGLGNDTSSLFALVREYSDGGERLNMSVDNNSIYSKGALVKVVLSDTVSVTSYGWTTGETSITDEYDSTGTLYAPNSSSTEVEFYGPTHFVAVLPKKLVILDDGVSATGEKGKLKNMDSLVEFDIEESSLSRGASVGATKPITANNNSYFTVL